MSDKKYSHEQWIFIKQFEERDPVFAEYLTRLRAHEQKYYLEDYGMSAEDIAKCEKSMLEFDPDWCGSLTAQDVHRIIETNLSIEHYELLHEAGLRARAEAAWLACPRYRPEPLQLSAPSE